MLFYGCEVLEDSIGLRALVMARPLPFLFLMLVGVNHEIPVFFSYFATNPRALPLL